MQRMARRVLMCVAALGAGAASAADFSDPTWPCVQRKVETLSPGLMWPFPLEADVQEPEPDQAENVRDLADALALRRVTLDDLRPQVAAFATQYDGDPEKLGLVFQRVFASLSKRRARVMAGIADFSLGQIELAQKIDQSRVEMTQLLEATAPDYDKVDLLEEQIDWDTVIHTDRQRSITYLCETPQIIERRLFAIARMLQEVAKPPG